MMIETKPRPTKLGLPNTFTKAWTSTTWLQTYSESFKAFAGTRREKQSQMEFRQEPALGIIPSAGRLRLVRRQKRTAISGAPRDWGKPPILKCRLPGGRGGHRAAGGTVGGRREAPAGVGGAGIDR